MEERGQDHWGKECFTGLPGPMHQRSGIISVSNQQTSTSLYVPNTKIRQGKTRRGRKGYFKARKRSKFLKGNYRWHQPPNVI